MSVDIQSLKSFADLLQKVLSIVTLCGKGTQRGGLKYPTRSCVGKNTGMYKI